MSSLERKMGAHGIVRIKKAIEPATKYGLLAVQNAVRLKKYVSGDSTHLVLDMSGGHITLPYEIRKITGFAKGTIIRYYKRGDIVILYSYDYKGDGSEFDKIKEYRYRYAKMVPDIFARAKAATTSISMLNDHHILIAESALKEVGINPTDSIVCAVFFDEKNNASWMEIRKATTDDDGMILLDEYERFLPTSSNLVISGLQYLDKIKKNSMRMPRSMAMYMDGKALTVWPDAARQVLVIEFPAKTCDICRDSIRSTEGYRKITVCESCRDHEAEIEKIARAIRKK